MSRSYIVLLAALGLLALASLGLGLVPENEPDAAACTQEAKMCPDGTSVGRVGPSCEFAKCPTTTSVATTTETPPLIATSSRILISTRIGTAVAGLGVTITPLSILSDSRCPQDVQCVWAGTVELKAKVSSASTESILTFKLGMPIGTAEEEIVLLEVAPAKVSKTDIATSSYMFTFEVSKR